MRYLFIGVINTVIALLTLFAGPYRVLAFKFRSFGGIGLGLVTWLGIVLAFPLCVALYTGVGDSLYPWLALIACAYVQMTAKWCAKSPPRDAHAPHSWAGRWEPPLAVALAVLAGTFSGPGGFLFFLAGYASSTAEWLLRRLKRRLEAWTPQDTARLLAPIHASAARWRALARAAREWLAWALPLGGRFTLRYGLLVASGAALLLKGVWSHLLARRAQAQAAPAAHGRPPGFGSRVMSYVVGHMVFSAITGVIGFNIIAIPFALILWALGWQVNAPWHVKEKARSVISRAREALVDEKEELAERFHDKREALEERFRHTREEVRERIDDGREEIADKARRAGRKAAWKLMTR